ALVQVGMVRQVSLCELPERDVGLPADTVASVENSAALTRFDILGLLLVGRLGGAPVPASIDPEVIEPVMATPRRCGAIEWVRVSARERLGFIPAATFAQTHRDSDPRRHVATRASTSSRATRT